MTSSKDTAASRIGSGQANLATIKRFEQAVAYYQDALVQFRGVGDHHGEGQVPSNLGTAYSELRQPDRAAACLKYAAKAMREAGEHQQTALLEQQAAKTRCARPSAATKTHIVELPSLRLCRALRSQ